MKEKKDYKILSATPNDSQAIWKIRYHPTLKQYFNRQEEIDFQDHNNWFLNKYFGPNKNYCYVLKNKDSLTIGYCRFDSDDDKLIVSIALLPEYCGQGLGQKLLLGALEQIKPGHTLCATVKKINQASYELFVRNGFILREQDDKNYYFCR